MCHLNGLTTFETQVKIYMLQGKLETGQIFDASKEEPIKFKLGEGRVIKGNI
jgi:FKBP-type peptidyl-prolyl cis-trans isomerase